MTQEQKLKFISAIKNNKLAEFWSEYTGNDINLYNDSIKKHFYLYKCLDLIHSLYPTIVFLNFVKESYEFCSAGLDYVDYWIKKVYLLETEQYIDLRY